MRQWPHPGRHLGRRIRYMPSPKICRQCVVRSHSKSQIKGLTFLVREFACC
jgi:hypothetical protein